MYSENIPMSPVWCPAQVTWMDLGWRVPTVPHHVFCAWWDLPSCYPQVCWLASLVHDSKWFFFFFHFSLKWKLVWKEKALRVQQLNESGKTFPAEIYPIASPELSLEVCMALVVLRLAAMPWSSSPGQQPHCFLSLSSRQIPSGLSPWPFSPRVVFLVDPALPPTLFITSLSVSVPVGYSGLWIFLLSCTWSLGCVFPPLINIPFLLRMER